MKPSKSIETGMHKTYHSQILLLWTKKFPNLIRKLSFNVLREVCSYLCEKKLIPGLSGASLRLYDLNYEEVKNVTLSVCFASGTVYCVFDNRMMLCMGEGSEVYSVSMNDFTVTKLEGMSQSRSFAGVFSYNGTAYVFGGLSDKVHLSSVEKYSLQTSHWTPLPDMLNPRYGFMPCFLDNKVYLPDPRYTYLEYFALLTEQFCRLQIKLPHTDASSVSFVAEGVLIVVSPRSQMSWCNLAAKATKFEVLALRNEGGYAFSNCPPLQYGREVFWVFTGSLNVLNLDEKTLGIRKLREVI